jgi:hypothetical protein
MGIEYLNLSQNWVVDDHAGSTFTDHEISTCHIHRLAIQGIGVHRAANNREAREDGQSST